MGYQYVSKQSDANGKVPYTPQEDNTWNFLIERQNKIVENRACDEFILGLEKLDLPKDRIPQNHEVSEKLKFHTGWSVESVPAVIPAEEFFGLLANKKFPAATFIRIPEEVDYLEEPDIFHEIYGHCPLLTHPAYADFMEQYGNLALIANKKQRTRLFRLFWYTIEFGLVNTQKGLRIYGGGILSSKAETQYALDINMGPELENLDIPKILRTPFRIDMIQPNYFVLNSFDELYKILDKNIMNLVDQAIELGDFPYHPKFLQKAEGGIFDDRPC